MAHSKQTFANVPSKRRLARILELLTAAPEGLTRSQLAAKTAISERAMKSYLAALRGEKEGFERQIRVWRWRRQLGTGGNHEAVFVIGTAADAKRPRPLSESARVKRYRARLKRERVEAYEDMLAGMRRRRALQRKPRRDRSVAALFGTTGAAVHDAFPEVACS